MRYLVIGQLRVNRKMLCAAAVLFFFFWFLFSSFELEKWWENCFVSKDNEGFDHYFNDSNDSSYGYRMLSTIPEIDDDNDDTEDSTNSSYESSSSSASSSEWRTETAWPWFQTDWNVYIINAKSTTEVWAQLIGSEYSVSK